MKRSKNIGRQDGENQQGEQGLHKGFTVPLDTAAEAVQQEKRRIKIERVCRLYGQRKEKLTAFLKQSDFRRYGLLKNKIAVKDVPDILLAFLQEMEDKAFAENPHMFDPDPVEEPEYDSCDNIKEETPQCPPSDWCVSRGEE